jgi:hypothetical protein
MRFTGFLLCLSAVAWAQTVSLTGNVTDPNGDGVPTAQVQARNTATGVVYQGVSAIRGNFTIPRIPAGTYDITVPPIGFTFPKYEQKGFTVQAGKAARLDIHLVWGGNLGTPGDDFSLLVKMRSKGPTTGPAPRGRDGKPDLSGVWIGNAPDVDAPVMLPWAEEITKQRRARGGSGNPGESCLPGDVFLVSPFLYKIIQTPSVMAILWEGNVPAVVQIFLDGRPHAKDAFPSWMGDSIGRWDGDTLVVDVTNLDETTWLSDNGLFHSDKTHVIERLRREGNTLHYDVTVEDPVVLAEPWKQRSRDLTMMKNYEIEEAPYCSERDKSDLQDLSHHGNLR